MHLSEIPRSLTIEAAILSENGKCHYRYMRKNFQQQKTDLYLLKRSVYMLLCNYISVYSETTGPTVAP